MNKTINLSILRFFISAICMLLVAGSACAQQASTAHEVDSLLKTLAENPVQQEELEINLRLAEIITNGRQSLKYAQRALQLAIMGSDKKKIAESYVEIGNDYERIDDFAQATVAILKASKYYEEIGYNKGYGIALNMSGSLYLLHGQYSKSIGCFNRAIQLHQSVKDSIPLADDYNNLGEVYRVKGSLDSALYYFIKALHLYESKKYKANLPYAIGNIGLVLAAQGKKNEAAQKLDQAIAILQELQDFYPISVYNIEMAKVSQKEGDWSQAGKLAMAGYNIAYKEGLKEQLRDASYVLYEVHSARKEYEKAMQYITKYYAYKDSIINEQTIQKIADLQTEYLVSKKEEQLSKLTIKSNRNMGIAIFLGIGLLLIAVLSSCLFLFNKRLKTANQTLESQRQLLETQKTIIQESLGEKETLLKEIHHRVKNNLQIISSLLNLQSNTLEDTEVIEIFQTGQSRIQSIALIHQKLYQNEEFSVIDIHEYIEQLSIKITDTLLNPDKEVVVNVEARSVLLDIDTAVPLGLIINELLTNSIKHAFSGKQSGHIHIQIVEMEKHRYKLHYRDSGPGLPEGIKVQCVQSLGSKLVHMLTRQLGGQVEQYNENGAHYIIKFYDMVKRKQEA